jgi:hypothetical protein
MNQDRQLPEEQLRIYLSNANRCPWCGGEVLADRVEADDIEHYARRSVYCTSCAREWDDIFRMVGIFVPKSREHYYLPETAPRYDARLTAVTPEPESLSVCLEIADNRKAANATLSRAA